MFHFRVLNDVDTHFSYQALCTALTLSQEFFAAGAPGASSFQTSGTLLLAVRDWSGNVISALAFGLGALMYYVILYKSNLIPRWLSGWGVLGAILGLAATVLASFTHDFSMGSVHTLLNVPIGLQELTLAVWLIAKGFNHNALSFLSTKTSGYQ